ncbi:glycosyltransferase [Bacillus cereus]
MLLIRPFHNRKYANDIAAKAIIELSKFSEFKDLEFSIYGEGKYFNKDTERLKRFQNVKINNRFLKQEEIADMHKKFGVFLCPTRQDAQGVSMCEAMASGLVPITSNNTAIPEFVDQNRAGFLTKGPKDIANAILSLYHDPVGFKEMSKKASNRINEICSYEVTIEKELDKIINLK